MLSDNSINYGIWYHFSLYISSLRNKEGSLKYNMYNKQRRWQTIIHCMYLDFSLKSLAQCLWEDFACKTIISNPHLWNNFLFTKTNGFLPFYMRASMRISLFKICYEIKIVTFTQWNRYYYDITQKLCCNIPGLE